MNFGEFVRQKRIDTELSLREFCQKIGADPSNWSKIERDLLPAPASREFLESIAKNLNLKKSEQQWFTFFDLASLSQQKIPDDVYEDENVLAALPVFFRTVRGEKPSEEELNNLITLIRQR